MRYAIYMPPNTKDLTINQAMIAYGNRQNAIAFTRANNSDSLQSLKHLMETGLYIVQVVYIMHIMQKVHIIMYMVHVVLLEHIALLVYIVQVL